MDIAEIKAAAEANPQLLDGLVLFVAETTPGKTLIENKAKAEFDLKIGEEIRKTHEFYDKDLLEILGDKPKNEGGKVEKSYEAVKRNLVELKRLKAIEANLNETDAVKKLKAENEKLLLEGGGKVFQEQLETAKKEFLQKEEQYKKDLLEARQGMTDGLVKNDIAVAKAALKLNPDFNETMRNLALNTAEAELLKNSKIVDGKVLYLKPDGTTILNAKYEPASASEVLATMDVIKEISLKDNEAAKGGGAPPGSGGNVQTVKVDGKDDAKKLVFPMGTAFTTKTDFLQKAEKALNEAGYVKGDELWDKLKNDAYTENKVSELPAE